VSSAGPSVAGSGPRPSAANEGKLVRKSTANRNTHNVSRWARRQSEDEYGAHAGARHGLGQDESQAGPQRTLKDRLYFWRNCTFRVVLTTVNISLLLLVILCLALYTILRGEQYVAPQRECVRGRGEERETERDMLVVYMIGRFVCLRTSTHRHTDMKAQGPTQTRAQLRLMTAY
jgi:hypothetical protein